IKNAVESIEGAGLEAIKNPLIVASAVLEDDFVRVSVTDNGKGWPKDNRQRLLEPYMTTREKGTGLGLAIVAKIIEQHGGEVELIDAEPDASGRVGACFTFTLPLSRQETGTPSAAAAGGGETAAAGHPAAAAAGGAKSASAYEEEPQLAVGNT